MLRELLRTILNVTFGDRTVDNAKDWYVAHDKARLSRNEAQQIIAESKRDSQSDV